MRIRLTVLSLSTGLLTMSGATHALTPEAESVILESCNVLVPCESWASSVSECLSSEVGLISELESAGAAGLDDCYDAHVAGLEFHLCVRNENVSATDCGDAEFAECIEELELYNLNYDQCFTQLEAVDQDEDGVGYFDDSDDLDPCVPNASDPSCETPDGAPDDDGESEGDDDGDGESEGNDPDGAGPEGEDNSGGASEGGGDDSDDDGDDDSGDSGCSSAVPDTNALMAVLGGLVLLLRGRRDR